MDRRCEQCQQPMPITARGHALTCSPRCRQRRSRRLRALPVEMTGRRRWVRRSRAKVPLAADTGRPASATGPTTWTTCRAAAASRYGVGLGYVLHRDDGIVCLDIDGCIDADGDLADWAADIVVPLLSRTYIETSPSGRGLHVWGRGHLDRGRRIQIEHGGRVEIYGHARYIALGERYADAPPVLADLSEVIASLT